MSTIKNFFSLVKFSHTIFAMPFAMIGFFLGISVVQGKSGAGISTGLQNPAQLGLMAFIVKLLLVLLCMVFARSAAMAFNRWLDKNFDALNPRTSIREIPAGIISANKALWFVIMNCIAFVISAAFINLLCFYLSFIALAVVLGYSYTKRFTPLCHLILGTGLSLAPIGAYLAVTASFAWLPLLFSFAVIFWVSGFDIIYALQDVDFDISQRLHSIPAWLGKRKALQVSRVLHLVSTICIVYAGVMGNFHFSYWLGVVVFAGMLVYQHSLVKPDDLRKVNLAFMTANGIASVVFSLFVITDLLVW
ncbi:MAG: UbiA-like polyprenyltransferase [Chitinophagaceae bacterium]